MKKFIRNLLLGLVTILATGGQPVFAIDSDLNTSVYNHLKNWETEFKIDYFEPDVLDVVKNISEKDDYLSVSIKRLDYENIGDSATLKVTYLTSKEQEEYINNELSKIVNLIIRDNVTDLNKVKTINKYLVDRYEYDNSFVSNNAYSALKTGKTTCQGYALTAYKMLNLAGIESRIITGKLKETRHGWNLAKLDGKWYHLDITSNDSVGLNTFFLKDDECLRDSGFTWDANDYPICDENYEESDNYYKLITKNYKSEVDGKWYLSNGLWYFLNSMDAYVTGWSMIDDKWYYLGYDGVMQTGWIYSSGKWYYCYPSSGEMATNATIDDYAIDSTGAWIE